MKTLLVCALLLTSGALFGSAEAATLKGVATLPEFSWALEQIGGQDVESLSLLAGSEDPHYIDASPAFVFKSSKADVLVYNGMQLEAGWLPKILQMSGNNKIQWGAGGNCDASAGVKKLETISDYDRSKGDIHPAGNPHYTLSVKAMIKVGEKIKECLLASGLEAKKKNLDANLKKYTQEMEALYQESAKKLAPLKGKKFMVYHREFSYLLDEHGLKALGSLEEVPGVLPSAAYLSKVAAKAKKLKVDLVLASSVSPTKYLDKFKELSGINYYMVQLHPGPGQDYKEFYRALVDGIVKHVQQ